MSPQSRRGIALAKSYSFDWALTLTCFIGFWSLNNVEGYKREFSLDDPTINFSNEYLRVRYNGSDLSKSKRMKQNWLLVSLCLIFPLIIMSMVNFAVLRSFWDSHNSFLGLILALSITGTVTNIMRVTIGRPRPDTVMRCQPRLDISNHKYGLDSVEVCCQRNIYLLNDGFRSFPSGHSGLAFAGLGFLAFYLAGKLHLFDKRGQAAKAWVSLVPLLAATLVAISRTMDNRHHWEDVTFGGILGIAIAFFSYQQYYSSLSHPLSHKPYGPRIIPSVEERQQKIDAIVAHEEAIATLQRVNAALALVATISAVQSNVQPIDPRVPKLGSREKSSNVPDSASRKMTPGIFQMQRQFPTTQTAFEEAAKRLFSAENRRCGGSSPVALSAPATVMRPIRPSDQENPSLDPSFSNSFAINKNHPMIVTGFCFCADTVPRPGRDFSLGSLKCQNGEACHKGSWPDRII